MAKKEAPASPSFDDFSAENLLDGADTNEKDELEKEEGSEEQEEEEKEEPKKKAKAKKEAPKNEDESDDESEEEEEEEEKPKKTQKPVKAQKVEKEEEAPAETEDEDEESEEDEQPASSEDFFAEVEKITGVELSVDYGDVDPLTPQGVALREAAVREAALDSFLSEIEEKYPRAYQALKYAYSGGDIAELFQQTLARDYSKVELKDGDESLAKEILKEYYKSKGVKSEERIAKMIAADEETEAGLVSEAKAALDEMKSEQEEARTKALEEQERKAAETRKKNQVLIAAVDEVLESRNLGSFKISDKAEAKQFKQYVLGSIQRTADGKYNFVTPIDQSNLEKVLQYQYFQFKKGDLSRIIQQKAATKTANELRLRVKGEAEKPKKSNSDEEKSRQVASLKSYTVG